MDSHSAEIVVYEGETPIALVAHCGGFWYFEDLRSDEKVLGFDTCSEALDSFFADSALSTCVPPSGVLK